MISFDILNRSIGGMIIDHDYFVFVFGKVGLQAVQAIGDKIDPPVRDNHRGYVFFIRHA